MNKPPKYRSEFGMRLHASRRRAGLSQAALAAKVGMSQSTLAEAETIAQGSAKTSQLALATGVDPHWLATGQGEMDGGPANYVVRESHATYGSRAAAAPVPIEPTLSARQLVLQLGNRLEPLDYLSRL